MIKLTHHPKQKHTDKSKTIVKNVSHENSNPGAAGAAGTGASILQYIKINLLRLHMEDIVKRTALRLKMHNVSGSIFHHVAILKRALDQQGIQCELIKGFCVIMESKEACEHYWIRETSTGLDFDVAFAVAKLRSPELQALHPVLLESCPPGLIHSDETESAIREENFRLFELFQRDPKAFWHEAPRDVVGFRVN